MSSSVRLPGLRKRPAPSRPLTLRARGRRPLLALLATGAALGAVGGKVRPAPVAAFPEASVLLLTLDTTRADHLGAYGHPAAATPALDGLAREGVRFTQSTSSAPLTLPAHASLLTGRDPLRHGVRDNFGYRLPAEVPTLAETLAAHGFATAAVVGSAVLSRGGGLDRGFQTYDDNLEAAFSGGPRGERPASEVVDRGLEWLSGLGQKRRFFLWLHFYDPHRPYAPPGIFAARYAADPYLGEIAYLDAEVGRLIESLRERGSLDGTLVLATADHGEGRGEHGEPDHGVFVYESTLQVPLVVRAPGRAFAGRVVSGLARDVDLMPTVLDLLGLPPPADLSGRSLRPLLEGRSDEARVAYAESLYGQLHYGWSPLAALRDDRYKYIEAPRPELYDLVADPGERRSILDERPRIATALQTRLQERRREHERRPAGSSNAALEAVPDAAPDVAPDAAPDTAAAEPGAGAREALRSLGYAAGTIRATAAPLLSLPDPKDRVASLALFAETVPATLRRLEAGDGPGAEAQLRQVLRAEPLYVDGHVLLARALRLQSRHEDAARALRTALALDPGSAATHADLAETLLLSGDEEQAASSLDAALRLAPRDRGPLLRGRFLLAKGRRRLQQGDSAGARLEIEAALAADPRLEAARFHLALAAEAEGRREDALRHYEEELLLFPRNHEAWANKGLLHEERGEGEAAVAAFGRLRALRPDLPHGHYLLARALFAKGRIDRQVRAGAQAAIEREPGFAPARELIEALDRARAEAHVGSR